MGTQILNRLLWKAWQSSPQIPQNLSLNRWMLSQFSLKSNHLYSSFKSPLFQLGNLVLRIIIFIGRCSGIYNFMSTHFHFSIHKNAGIDKAHFLRDPETNLPNLSRLTFSDLHPDLRIGFAIKIRNLGTFYLCTFFSHTKTWQCPDHAFQSKKVYSDTYAANQFHCKLRIF